MSLASFRLAAAAALSSFVFIQPAFLLNTTDEQFVTVHFSTSCNDVAQRRFDRAMRYQHSFWYGPAAEIFEETLKADPGCAIAYWGIALSLGRNPHVPPPRDNLAPGRAALEK